MVTTSTTRSPSRTRAVHSTAVVGAGIAGLSCARTLAQAGHTVTVLEAAAQAGGRMATLDSPWGTFDLGTQYFTVRDARLKRALDATASDLARRWSANAVRVLDDRGRLLEAAPPAREPHWVAAPDMQALPLRWTQPLAAAGRLLTDTRVLRIERDALSPTRWQLHAEAGTGAQAVHTGFDRVVLALPAPQARELLQATPATAALASGLKAVDMAPCWTLTLAFPHAVQPGLQTLGPQWNAARSTHHRIAWLARESSKPGRGPIERWTVQASAAWSRRHAGDAAERVSAKLLKAFAEVTGIRATPALAQAHRWPWAQTQVPLGQPFVWHAAEGVGLAGDWCLGHRLEDAFVSGLELALRMLRD